MKFFVIFLSILFTASCSSQQDVGTTRKSSPGIQSHNRAPAATTQTSPNSSSSQAFDQGTLENQVSDIVTDYFDDNENSSDSSSDNTTDISSDPTTDQQTTTDNSSSDNTTTQDTSLPAFNWHPDSPWHNFHTFSAEKFPFTVQCNTNQMLEAGLESNEIKKMRFSKPDKAIVLEFFCAKECTSDTQCAVATNSVKININDQQLYDLEKVLAEMVYLETVDNTQACLGANDKWLFSHNALMVEYNTQGPCPGIGDKLSGSENIFPAIKTIIEANTDFVLNGSTFWD